MAGGGGHALLNSEAITEAIRLSSERAWQENRADKPAAVGPVFPSAT